MTMQQDFRPISAAEAHKLMASMRLLDKRGLPQVGSLPAWSTAIYVGESYVAGQSYNGCTVKVHVWKGRTSYEVKREAPKPPADVLVVVNVHAPERQPGETREQHRSRLKESKRLAAHMPRGTWIDRKRIHQQAKALSDQLRSRNAQ